MPEFVGVPPRADTGGVDACCMVNGMTTEPASGATVFRVDATRKDPPRAGTTVTADRVVDDSCMEPPKSRPGSIVARRGVVARGVNTTDPDVT